MSTFFDYLKTSNDYVSGKWDGIYCFDNEFLGVKFQVSENGEWLNLNSLKSGVDKACHTLSNNTSQFLNSPNMAELRWHFPEYFKIFDDGDVWMNVAMIPIYDVIQDMFKRSTAYSCWKLGKADWESHLFEFIYIRCDPKFKLVDWIIKGGRELNPGGRETNYWHNAVDDGCGTIYALFVVNYGSPAEKKLKELFAKNFSKAPDKVDGKKTGAEYYCVNGVDSKESFEEKIMKVAGDFANVMSDIDELVDDWYIEYTSGLTPNQFILKYAPWLEHSLPKYELGKKKQ